MKRIMNRLTGRMTVLNICLLIVSMVLIGINQYSHKNYISKEIFENIRYIYHYDDLIREKHGEYQEKIVYNKSGYPCWLVDCGDVKVLYDYGEDSADVLRFMYAQITDSSYLFGGKGIRVGMDRDAAEKILKNAKKPTPDPYPILIIDDRGETHYQDAFGYYDDIYDWGMGIIYDENNNISHILPWYGL